MKYNTAEIRAVAARVRAAAGEVSDAGSDQLRPMISDIPAHLEGRTADAMVNAVSQLSRDVTSIASGLRSVSQQLYAFADRLDAADAAAKAIIQQQ